MVPVHDLHSPLPMGSRELRTNMEERCVEAIKVDANAMHFHQTTIRVTTRAAIDKESTLRLLGNAALRIRDEARYLARTETRRQATGRRGSLTVQI